MCLICDLKAAGVSDELLQRVETFTDTAFTTLNQLVESKLLTESNTPESFVENYNILKTTLLGATRMRGVTVINMSNVGDLLDTLRELFGDGLDPVQEDEKANQVKPDGTVH